ncbi:MAG: hypothetical protein U0175_05065 [Caldilineaceae bacterium]
MSYATDALLQALHYDAVKKTFTLAAGIGRLGQSRAALRAAFGEEPIELRNAAIEPNPPPAHKGSEVLALHGVGELFGHHSRELYLELLLVGGEVQSLLLLIPLPEKGWRVATGFPAVAAAPSLPDLRLRDGVIVVSYGLRHLAGSRTVYELDRDRGDDEAQESAGSTNPVPRKIALGGYEVEDGLQIVADGLVGGSEALPEKLWSDAAPFGLDTESLPDRSKEPTRIDLRGDADAGWLQLECWWEDATALAGTGAHVQQAAGLALRYDLKQPKQGFHYWLRELHPSSEANAEPIILEAYLLEGFTPRYGMRLGHPIPLGQSVAALSALIGPHSQLVQDLALELPEILSLVALTYTPGESILFTVTAGDRTLAEKHLVQIGPFDLSQVDFTFSIPLAGGPPIVEMSGLLAFAGVHFQVRVRTWDLIEGSLDEPDGVHLGHFLEQALPVPLPFALDTVTLQQARLQRMLPDGKASAATTSLRIYLDGKVALVPNALLLDSITLDLQKTDQGETLGSIAALLTLGPLSLAVNAEREADGWTFAGTATAPPEGISLTKLVEHLVHALGATVPSEVPDVYLEQVALSYATATRTLDLQAISDWKMASDVPVVGGSEAKALLQLTVTRHPQQGKTNVTLAVNCTLSKATLGPGGETDAYQLEAQAMLSADAQSFGFDFDAPEGDPLTLSAVATGLGLPEIPTPASNLLDAVFQLSSLSMNYARPGNTFDIAWTRSLGDGTLLAEYNQSSALQSAPAADGAQSSATSRFVQVSWLGNQESSTLGLDDLLALLHQQKLADTLISLPYVGTLIHDLLTFRQLGFTWQADGGHNSITFTALSTYRQGTQAFLAVGADDKEGIVAGIAFTASALPESAVPGNQTASLDSLLGDLPFLPDGVKPLLSTALTVLQHIELTHILLSTVNSNRYQPPLFAPDTMQPSFARQAADAPNTPFGTGTMALSRGVAVGVRVKFGEHDLIRRVIDVDELDGQVTLGEVLALQISIPGTLSLDAGGGNNLSLTAPQLRLKQNLESPEAGPEFDLQGGLELHLFGARVAMNGWLGLAEESLSGHIQLTDLSLPIPLTPIAALPGVQLVINNEKPLSLEVGLQFEPPGLDLGLGGSFAIYKDKDELTYGDVVFVLELVEEVPQPLYVAFGLEEMSIPVWLEAMTGVQYRLHLADAAAKLAAEAAVATGEAANEVATLGSSDAGDAVATAGEATAEAAQDASTAIEAVESALSHIEAILNQVELNDVRFHWADSIVNLPDGSTAMPGVGVRGGLKIFDWNAYAELELSAQGIPGMMGHFEAEKIEIGRILKIWGDGKGIRKPTKSAKAIHDQVNANVDALQPADPSTAPPAGQDEADWFLEPGGALLQLSTRTSPFFHADLHAELFGFLHEDIHAEITDEGFSFDFKIGAGNAVTTELECHWWHNEGRFEAHGDMGIHLHGDLGPILPHVPATQFHLDTDLDAHVLLSLDSKQFLFVINGTFHYQGVSLHIPELKIDFPFSTLADLAKAVWAHIVAKAEAIFAEILLPAAKFIADGAKEVAQVAVAAAHEVAEVATAAAQDVKRIAEDVAQTVDKAADEIGRTASDLSNQAEDVAKQAAAKALAAAAPLLDKAEKLGEKALQFAQNAATSVKAIAEEVSVVVSEAAHYVIHVAEEAAHWVAARLDEARRWVAARLDEAKALVNQLAQEAEVAVQAIEASIAEIEDEIEQLLAEIEEKAEQVVSGVWHAVTPW